MLEIIKLAKQPEDLYELASDLRKQGKEATAIDVFHLGKVFFVFAFVNKMGQENGN